MKSVIRSFLCVSAVVAMTCATTPAQAAGADVIVGSLHNLQSYGTVGSIAAFSVGTTSCNIGTTNLLWLANVNQHPVIGQNLYRLMNGRFEHIGMSWLKHGFFALSGTLCGSCPVPTDGTTLGVGCSDPYDAGLNGSQGGLGPRSQVDAATGFYPYPFANPPGGNNAITKRLQVATADIAAASNPGALYFVEGHYVTPDDAAAGNDNNNASYRRVQFSGNTIQFVAGFNTVQQQPAIRAWAAFDTGVSIKNVDVTNDGRFIIAYKATLNGNGTWHHEYCIQNLNSHRSAESFSVPVAAGEILTNIGFKDVNYHTGDGNVIGTNYSGTDWTSSVSAGAVTWSTQSFLANPNANALRWGSSYNFRYDSTLAPPVTGQMVTLGLYRAGVPASVTTTIDPVTNLSLVSGDSQYSEINSQFSQPIIVRTTTTSGVGLGGIPVNFAINAGGPIGTSLSAVSVMSDPAGFAQVHLNAGPNGGTVTVTASTGMSSVTSTQYVHQFRSTFTGASGIEIVSLNTAHPSFRNQHVILCYDVPQAPHQVFGFTICTSIDSPQPGFFMEDGVGLFAPPNPTVRTNTAGTFTRVYSGLGALFNSGVQVQMQVIMFPGIVPVYITQCVLQTF